MTQALPLNINVIYNGSDRSASRDDPARIVSVSCGDEGFLYDLSYADETILRGVPEAHINLSPDAIVYPLKPEEELLGQNVRFRYRADQWKDFYGAEPISSLDGVSARVAAVHSADKGFTFTLQFSGQSPLEKVHFYAEDLERVPDPTPLAVERVAF